MRLIDADALEDQLGISDRDIYVKEMLCESPTIDAMPIKHAHWQENKYKITECSHCHGFALETMTGCLANRHIEPNLSAYCPSCGTKMEQSEAHNE